MRVTRVAFLLCLSLMLANALTPGAQTPPAGAQPGQQEFVPLKELPPEEQLPAAPLLITAYAFVWVVILAYVWSIWRRLARVERELDEVTRRMSARRGQV